MHDHARCAQTGVSNGDQPHAGVFRDHAETRHEFLAAIGMRGRDQRQQRVTVILRGARGYARSYACSAAANKSRRTALRNSSDGGPIPTARGERQGADEPGHGGDGLCAAARAFEPPCDWLQQGSRSTAPGPREGRAHDLPLRAASVPTREGAAAAGIVAMTRREVVPQQGRVGMIGRSAAMPSQFARGACHVRRLALRDEISFERNAVEAPCVSRGRLHDVGDADTAETLGAKQSGPIDDTVAVRAAFSRPSLSWCSFTVQFHHAPGNDA